jgi:hypothetical protein
MLEEHDRFLRYSFQFIIHNHLTIQSDITYLIEEPSIINQKLTGTVKGSYDSSLHGWKNFELKSKWRNVYHKI